MHTGKAVGINGIPLEFLRGAVDVDGPGHVFVSALHEYIVRMFNLILTSGRYPDAWRLVMLVPLLKGTNLDASLPTNYRGISLISVLAKCFAGILESRLTAFQWATRCICDVQFGFTRDRRTLDPVFILDTLIDRARAEKTQLYVAFIDFQKAYDFVPHSGLFYKMIRHNMVGPIYRVLHSMYASVKSVVRHGLDLSDVINQQVGLRQGCILSPCLFSIYISDLPDYLVSKGCVGVPLDETTSVRALLYADDGALVAKSKADLQKMLDALKEYCSKWRMFVNVVKTHCIVFNHTIHQSWLTQKPTFFYDGIQLELVESFKYLGVVFHATLKYYKASIEYRLDQGKRLVAMWIRRCKVWCFRPDVVINQFNTCVLPALEYGVGLWGVGMYNKQTWKHLEVFWRSIARNILGVPPCTPISGLQGELAWFPFSVRASWQATSMWTRISRMPTDALTRKAMCIQRALVDNEKECWLLHFRDTLCETGLGRMLWQSWSSIDNFASTECTCAFVQLVDGKRVVTKWEDLCGAAFREDFVSKWLHDIEREESHDGTSLNKLRTYKCFKRAWGIEPYLLCVDSRDRRVLLSKFRIGTCPLRIETGRYEIMNGTKRVPALQRFCLCCNTQRVEDEFHFLIICPIYTELRCSLFAAVTIQLDKDVELSSEEKISIRTNTTLLFKYIMQSDSKDMIYALVKYVWKAFKCRESMLV